MKFVTTLPLSVVVDVINSWIAALFEALMPHASLPDQHKIFQSLILEAKKKVFFNKKTHVSNSYVQGVIKNNILFHAQER